MRSTTDLFARVLRAAHVLSVKAILTPAGGSDVELEVTGGSVTLDRTATQRARATLSVTTKTSVAAFGDRVHLSRGLAYADGSTELVSLGHFRVDEVDDALLTAELSLTLADLSAQISEDIPTTPLTYPKTALTQHVIEDLVLRTYPSVTTHLPGDTHTLTQPLVITDDPWQAISDPETGLAIAIGCEAYFDADGEFRLQAIPDRALATSVYRIDAGLAGVLVDATRKQTRDQVRNGVRFVGEQIGKHAPVSYLATDDDPASPTYWSGPYGHVPEVQTSQHLANAGQAQIAAQARLRDLLGSAKSVDIVSVPIPQLEPGDCVTVGYPDGTNEAHLIDQVAIPLSVTDQMALTTRSQSA